MVSAALPEIEIVDQRQIFKVRLAGAGEVIVLSAPPADAATIAALRDRFPSAVVVAIREERTGWARADGTDGEWGAAAVALVKASCGWDESSPIRIEIGDQRFDVVGTFDGETWSLDVQRV